MKQEISVEDFIESTFKLITKFKHKPISLYFKYLNYLKDTGREFEDEHLYLIAELLQYKAGWVFYKIKELSESNIEDILAKVDEEAGLKKQVKDEFKKQATGVLIEVTGAVFNDLSALLTIKDELTPSEFHILDIIFEKAGDENVILESQYKWVQKTLKLKHDDYKVWE